MCFSEQASFTSAAVLGLMSIGCFKLVKHDPKLYALAAIPLFFGIQQGAEGIQWLYFKGIWGNAHLAEMARNIFAFFAFCFWPVWLPLSLYLAEKENQRKFLLLFFTLAGAIYSLFSGWNVFFGHLDSSPVGHSVQYDTPLSINELWPYMALVFTPWFISSLPRMAYVGMAYVSAALVAGYVYQESFTSVWCFFAAIVSIFLIVALKSACPEKHPTKRKQ